jgi:hypothetical protein
MALYSGICPRCKRRVGVVENARGEDRIQNHFGKPNAQGIVGGRLCGGVGWLAKDVQRVRNDTLGDFLTGRYEE